MAVAVAARRMMLEASWCKWYIWRCVQIIPKMGKQQQLQTQHKAVGAAEEQTSDDGDFGQRG